MTDFSKLLNPEQFAAATAGDGPVLVLAAAGTGKTRTLVHRVAYLIEQGVPEEDARYILPAGIATTLILTMNVRELRHFFSLRCCNRAQWEIRNLADTMLMICQREAPELFENAGAPCMAGKPCPEMKPCGKPRRKVEE